jgi:hypothetical protein
VSCHLSGTHAGAGTPFPVRLSHATNWVPTRSRGQDEVAVVAGAGEAVSPGSWRAAAGSALTATTTVVTTVTPQPRRVDRLGRVVVRVLWCAFTVCSWCFER